ncbi:hypothetical protein I316_07113 [Kwoniella heveanensis BCC8398]|uniref:Uncharacterized protein n=1 Tax=Kwoniella heveanensis BCC8398 TaxID=1296120 RepID=A0A1B9GJK3_9TREE|nr:hypothetical protein I316_07113 [Kwoniella heveanensis BCC8398]
MSPLLLVLVLSSSFILLLLASLSGHPAKHLSIVKINWEIAVPRTEDHPSGLINFELEIGAGGACLDSLEDDDFETCHFGVPPSIEVNSTNVASNALIEDTIPSELGTAFVVNHLATACSGLLLAIAVVAVFRKAPVPLNAVTTPTSLLSATFAWAAFAVELAYTLTLRSRANHAGIKHQVSIGGVPWIVLVAAVMIMVHRSSQLGLDCVEADQTGDCGPVTLVGEPRGRQTFQSRGGERSKNGLPGATQWSTGFKLCA